MLRGVHAVRSLGRRCRPSSWTIAWILIGWTAGLTLGAEPIGGKPGPAAVPAASSSAAPPSAPALPLTEPAPSDADQKTARDASALAQKGDHAGALKLVDEMFKRSGESAFYDELRGTVLTLAKDYPAAEQSFSAMLKRQPASYIARFNRAETIMLQRRFNEAEEEFAKVEADRAEVDASVAALAHFKRVACLIGAGKLTQAELLVQPIKEGEESPSTSYARAMIKWVRKDSMAAIKLLTEARARFSAQVDDLYTDTFVELRWGRRDPTGQFVFSPTFR